MEPWTVPPQPVYRPKSVTEVRFAIPENLNGLSDAEFVLQRREILRQWGARREQELQRPPVWCMDQLNSGSGLYPPRFLDDTWFTKQEKLMIQQLEVVLAETGSAAAMARDMMALRIYDIDVRIICDDSGSMNNSMLPGAWGSGWTSGQVQQVFGNRAFTPDSVGAFAGCPLGPSTKRWVFLVDALTKWEKVFKILDVERKLYLLNDRTFKEGSVESVLSGGPVGGTPMGSKFANVLNEYQQERSGRPLLMLALTDGEANDKPLFNSVLDQIQDGAYGDVQVCLMGLSLEAADIEWFEDEECDDTRIRTIEAWEVEQQQILWRKVIQRSADYNFAMHTFRALVTNYFPADYDYEAPVQTLRHRLYITLHALDRRFTGRRDNTYANDNNYNSDYDDCCCFGFLFGQTPPRPNRSLENQLENEGFDQIDEQALAQLFESLKVQAMEKQRVEYQVLKCLQRAIGCLQPSEQQMRDLQYIDKEQNRRVVTRALVHLREASLIAKKRSQ